MKSPMNIARRLVVISMLLFIGIGTASAYDISVVTAGKRLYYNVDNDKGTAVVTYYGDSNNYWPTNRQPADSLFIPSTITYQGRTYVVNAIGDHAFSNCTRIKDVIVGDSITSIGDYAFQYCSLLRSITLAPSGITRIGTSAFESCIALKKIPLPQTLNSLGEGVFAVCRQLDSIVLPNTVTRLPNHLFYACNSLMTLTIPASLTSIGDFTFRECNRLRTIDLPNSVTHIGNSAFVECSNLQYIYLPESLDTIKAYTFRNCTHLTHVRIPASVYRIESNAFANASNLNDIVVLNTQPPTLGNNTFLDVDRAISVHIPCGTYDQYSAAEGWNEFTHLIEYPGYKLQYYAADTSMGTVEVVVEPTCTDSTAVVRAVPFRNHQFTHWNDGDTTNPRTVDVTIDSILIAHFIYVEPIGIDPLPTLETTITSLPGLIQIAGAEGLDINIFDITGRLCSTIRSAASPQRIAVDRPGVYLVQIAGRPARKVVVLPAR